jgi:hypothetical protein
MAQALLSAFPDRQPRRPQRLSNKHAVYLLG